MPFNLQTLVADARAAMNSEGKRIGPAGSDTPRFELFGAANSICSQKVRAVLAHHGLAYRSHAVDLFGGGTYLPAYVRLRVIGCDAMAAPLVRHHSGSTSVASGGGCDAAVVPTLIDWETGEIVVDSKRICNHIDATVLAPRAALRPAHLADRIDAEIDVIDNLPNYQMMAGLPPETDLRPEALRGKTGVLFAMGKVERCDRYLAEYANDPALVRAYTAKRAKELSAALQLFSAEAMQGAYEKAAAACDALEHKRKAATTSWLLGDQPTMADLYWGVEFTRLHNLGAHTLWAQGARPALADYSEKTRGLPAIRLAILDWPGALF